MGIDGIEFHLGYHQNLDTFQKVWLFQNFLSQISYPWSNHILKIELEIHFLKTSGSGGIT